MPMPQPPFNSPIQTQPTIKGVVSIVNVWQNWLQLAQIYLANLTGSGPTSARPTTNLWVGQPFFDTTINVPVYWDGSTWVTSAPSDTVTAVTGTAPISSSGGTTPDISISQAGASSNGYLSSTDWSTFNGKVSSVSGTSPVVSSGGANPAISMPAANATTSGYLTSTDWNTFNSTSTRNFVDVAIEYGPSYGGRTSAAIQAAINANPGRTIYLRGGTTNPTDFWAISASVAITRGCTLVGDGEFTLLYPAGGLTNANLIDIETTEPVHIDNMQILGNNVTGINGIKVSGGSGAENINSRFSRLNVYACTTGILFYSAYTWTLVDSVLHACTSQCIYITEVVNQDHGDCLISGCEFDQPVGVGYCINQVGMGGIRIIGNKFINGIVHWLVVPNGNPINDAIFEGNSSENASDHHILLDGTNGVINNVVISGNQIALGNDKNGVTGIRLTGDGIDSPCQINIMGNTIWVRHTNQTGIAITAGGYDGSCYNTIYVANNNLYSQNGPSNQYAIALQNIASVRCGVNNIAWDLINSANNWAQRYIITTSQTCQFDMGQAQSGSSNYMFFNIAYGTFAGNTLWCTGDQPITFNNKFPQTPAVTAYIVDSASSGYGFQIKNVTASGFTINVLGWTYNNPVTINWNAWLTGQ